MQVLANQAVIPGCQGFLDACVVLVTVTHEEDYH